MHAARIVRTAACAAHTVSHGVRRWQTAATAATAVSHHFSRRNYATEAPPSHAGVVLKKPSNLRRTLDEELRLRSNASTKLFIERFADLRLGFSLLRRLYKLGYQLPTDLQKEVLPRLFRGDSIFMHAATGTGKTIAYLLPIATWAAGILRSKPASIIVLVPTRELATQVAALARAIAGRDIASVALLPGDPMDPQVRRMIDACAPIVVATPRAFNEAYDLYPGMFGRNNPPRTVVVDEGDAVLKVLTGKDLTATKIAMRQRHPPPGAIALRRALGISEGDDRHIGELFDETRPRAEDAFADPETLTEQSLSRVRTRLPQLVVVSATIPRSLRVLVSRLTGAVLQTVNVGKLLPPADIAHSVVLCEPTIQDKLRTLADLMLAEPAVPSLVFLDDHARTTDVIDGMRNLGIDARALHESNSKSGVEGRLALRAMLAAPDPSDVEARAPKQRRHPLAFVTTEGVSRGLDFPGLKRVYLLEPAKTATGYLHVSGRVGRVFGRPAHGEIAEEEQFMSRDMLLERPTYTDGVVVTLASRGELGLVEDIGTALNIVFCEKLVPKRPFHRKGS